VPARIESQTGANSQLVMPAHLGIQNRSTLAGKIAAFSREIADPASANMNHKVG
jgi:hypothetical protein